YLTNFLFEILIFNTFLSCVLIYHKHTCIILRDDICAVNLPYYFHIRNSRFILRFMLFRWQFVCVLIVLCLFCFFSQNWFFFFIIKFIFRIFIFLFLLFSFGLKCHCDDGSLFSVSEIIGLGSFIEFVKFGVVGE